MGRLAALRGDWPAAQQHALAHLAACVQGGHGTYVPACLDALGEVAAGLGADKDAVRLFAAAESARSAIGIVRIPPEEDHWTTIERRLHDALGGDAYNAARVDGAELSPYDALEWEVHRRGSGGSPRHPPSNGAPSPWRRPP